MSEGNLSELLVRFKSILEGEEVPTPEARFETYAVTNFRGGIGKSTLAFNLAYQVAEDHPSLLVDVCPQRNFTQSLTGDGLPDSARTIYDALLPKVMSGVAAPAMDDLLTNVKIHCDAFKGGKPVFLIPGSNELFLFPSLLYTQLSSAAQLGTRSKEATRNILESVCQIIASARAAVSFDRVLIDTSPFFGGATHLAWVAADALIIPVRVDQHSVEALKLTLAMLEDGNMDFLRLNHQGGIDKRPKVHAIAMTHCGWNRQQPYSPDRSTQAFLQSVLEVMDDHKDAFSSDNPIECMHLLDDFHSAGRISGQRRIPLAKLRVGEQFTVEGQRLEVNQSLTRYQQELTSLASTI